MKRQGFNLKLGMAVDQENSPGGQVVLFSQSGTQCCPPSAMSQIHRSSKFAAELEHAADVITVFMGDHNRIHVGRRQAYTPKPAHGLFYSEATVHHQAGGGFGKPALKKPTVAFAAAA